MTFNSQVEKSSYDLVEPMVKAKSISITAPPLAIQKVATRLPTVCENQENYTEKPHQKRAVSAVKGADGRMFGHEDSI